MAGEHLAEVERICAEAWEKETWKSRQSGSIEAEMVRRGLDVPVLGDLLRAALKLSPDSVPPPPDLDQEHWSEPGQTASLSSTARAGGRPAVAEIPPPADQEPPARIRAAERALQERTRSLVVVLDDLVGARNASAVVRTAEALGLQEVHIVQREGRVALERTVTMLAERWLDLFWYQRAEEAISSLREADYSIWVADYAPDAVALSEVPISNRMALVLGSEQRGVSSAMRDAADGFFYMPTAGFTSYVNVSVMAGIALYDIDSRMRVSGVRQPLETREQSALREAWYPALARGDRERAARYLGWVNQGVAPAQPKRASAERPGSSTDG
ncbi:MAG: RNA methyltransferase [Myxococcota bacterium]|nr:RNA methyltransferase [Myxococcota bacterium]